MTKKRLQNKRKDHHFMILLLALLILLGFEAVPFGLDDCQARTVRAGNQRALSTTARVIRHVGAIHSDTLGLQMLTQIFDIARCQSDVVYSALGGARWPTFGVDTDMELDAGEHDALIGCCGAKIIHIPGL